VNSQGQLFVAGGEILQSDLAYTTQQCIPGDSYTVTIYDSYYGDGLCCGTNPGYTLTVNGSIMEVGGADDFGLRRLFPTPPLGECGSGLTKTPGSRQSEKD
jgi:hypothetical protein